jgi:ADP-ribose pyrophosphatase
VSEPPSVERREVFRGNLIRVEVWTGRYREIVRHPGSCVVVAVTADGDVLLVRQRRDPVEEDLLEVPAGTRDRPGEDARTCAARELLEETGHRAVGIEPLGRVYASPGFLDEAFELFLARAEPSGDPEEDLEVVRLPLDEAVEAVADGRIADAKSAVGILLAERRLSGRASA